MLYRLYLRILPLLLLCFMQAAWAQPLDVDPVGEAIALTHGSLSYLADRSGHLTLDQVRARQDFRPLRGNLSQGFTHDVYWLKLDLRRKTAPADWWLEVRPSTLDDVQFFQINPNGEVISKHSGDRLPMSSRDARYASFFFKVAVPEGDSTIYLRVQTTSSMLVIARLQRADVFPVVATTRYLSLGLYIGIIMTVFLLGAVYVLIQWQPLYVVYLIYLMFQLTHVLAGTGIAAEFVFPDHPDIPDRLVGFSLSMAVAFGMLFFARLLRLQDGKTWLLRMFQAVAIIGALTALAALVGEYGALAAAMFVALLLTLLMSVFTVGQRLLYGDSLDRLFVLSFLAFMIFVCGSALPSLGQMAITEGSISVVRFSNVSHLLLLQVTMMLRIRSAEEEALVARQEVAQRQRMVAEQDQFLAMITHEIRTPMSIINAAADSLRMLDRGQQSPEREVRYERIAQAVKRVDTLIDLSISRDRPDQVSEASFTLVDMLALTREMLGQLPAEQRERVHLAEPEQSATVSAHAGLLQFSLLNLVDNACKYSPPESIIDINIRSQPDHGGVSWVISDQGPGIPREDQDRIFDKYFRSAERAGMPGLGLGLYIADSLVTRFGGRLSYRDGEQVGACFEVWLPSTGA